MKKVSFFLSIGVLLATIVCMAKEPPVPRIVDLTATDGIKLKASYFSAGKPGPGILLLHQCDHDRKIWDGLAQQLAAAGFNVLTFDYRGYGDSGDRPHNPVGSGPLEPEEEMKKWLGDIDVAFQYLKSQPGVKADPVGVAGGSCGVSNAIKTAMRHPEVKSLVLLAGPADLKDREFLRQSKVPMFFAVADDDQYPPVVPLTELLYTISASPGKKFAHYQTGHHAAEIFAVHPDLPVAIVDWFRTTLIKTPGKAPAQANAQAFPELIHQLDLLEQPGGPAKLQQQLAEARKKNPKAPFVQELALDGFAYEHLQAGDHKGALEILKLAEAAYPDSPNVYDNLADAYLAAGDKELARQNSQKALEKLATDTTDPQPMRDAIKASAEERLKKLDATK